MLADKRREYNSRVQYERQAARATPTRGAGPVHPYAQIRRARERAYSAPEQHRIPLSLSNRKCFVFSGKHLPKESQNFI
jgi:hypothetical protein